MPNQANQAYALAEEHYNARTEGYDATYTAFREQDMNGVTDPDEIAAALLETLITESHMSGDGRPLGYAPAHGEYRVRLYRIDPAILVADDFGDETLPDGFQPDGGAVATALWQLNEKN